MLGQIFVQQEFRKINKLFEDELDFEDIKFPVKTRYIHKIGKRKCIGISVFGCEIQQKYPIYMSTSNVKRNALIYY